MILEIPFNEDFYKRQTSLHLDLTWNKILKNHKTNFIVCIFSILLGVILIYGKSNLGYVFVTISIYGFFEYYKIITAYRKVKKEFQQIVNNEIRGQLESQENSIWEFNEEYFRYMDYKYDSKIKWIAFKSYRIIEDNIFLDLNVGNNSSYIIGKEEIGENYFKKIIVFLDKKNKKY